ncbi:hypothetical protein GH714_039336 [Hevea brasiliensis]|uniref:Uncharacterized protein n=1 Tax=Hevea brasiliensis TaxID=3981 RepID=A0A6A6MTF8_HEVBR|nr:hypothetical protein GH714_039336 [Hevea brasiliensis]
MASIRLKCTQKKRISKRHGSCPLDLGSITLAELLHLMAALHRNPQRGCSWASASNGFSYFLLMIGLKVATTESVPFVAVGIDQGNRFIVDQYGGGRRRGLVEGCGGAGALGGVGVRLILRSRRMRAPLSVGWERANVRHGMGCAHPRPALGQKRSTS